MLTCLRRGGHNVLTPFFVHFFQVRDIVSNRTDVSRIISIKRGEKNKALLEVLFTNGESGVVGLNEFYRIGKDLVTAFVVKNKLQNEKGMWMVRKRLRTSCTTDEGLVNNACRKLKRRRCNKGSILGQIDLRRAAQTATPKDADKEWIYLQWECLRRKISISDYHTGSSIRENNTFAEGGHFKETVVSELNKKVLRSKRKGEATTFCSLSYDQFSSLSEAERYAFIVAIETEQRFKAIDLSVCSNCMVCNVTPKRVKKRNIGQVRPEESNSSFAELLCDSCYKNEKKFGLDNNVIPYWIGKDGIRYTTVPQVLQELTFAEKQLIALVTSHMNLIHLKNGTLGSTGHVVALEQDISSVATILPRLPKDVRIVKVLRKSQTKKQEVFEKMFTVRKQVVLDALRWLVQHNQLYKQYAVRVEEKNLEWMGTSETAVLPVFQSLYDHSSQNYSGDDDDDTGPAPTQTLTGVLHKENAEFDVAGTFSNIDSFVPSEEDRELLKTIKNSKYGKKKGAVINWPEFSDKAISEYGEKKIFCMLFPWLYPGGNGDYNEERKHKVTPKEWAKQQLFLKDGRFAEDKIWCFYALNYAERRRNMDQGRWFINYFMKENINNVEQLQQKIEENKSSFIPKLQYYSRLVPGSDAYWREKKGELVSWMSHHINAGNGPPSFFITLSCAEYHWKDIEYLIKKRYKIAKDANLDLSKLSQRIDAMNDYAVVVQEYFQRRTQEFLDFYCKKVFGIHHYYVRYEFAKSRGQIHAHLMAILGKESKVKNFNLLAHKYNYDKEKQAEVLDAWMTEILNLTAMHPASDKNGNLVEKKIVPPEGTERAYPEVHPSRIYCSDITNVKDDNIDLCNYCQMHKCSGYCLIHTKKTKPSKKDGHRRRECRFNAGIEETAGKADTPGFKLQTKATITDVGHGFTFRKEFRCKRNTRRLNQTSLYLAQIWRGNVDIKPLLYKSNPLYPDYEDIVEVTDYVIGYEMKGGETLKVKRRNLTSFIMNSEDPTGTKEGLYSLAQKWMNRASVSRIISRQEANCLLASLHLTSCTEHMENISLAYKIEISNRNKGSWTQKYSRDNPALALSFHQYVYHKLNDKKKSKKNIIPHYTGALQYCPIPLTENYCYNALMVYKPWNETCPITKTSMQTFTQQFLDLIKSPQCPTSLLITYERALRRRNMQQQGLLSYEPTSTSNTYYEDMEETDYLPKETSDILETMRNHKVDIEPEDDKFEKGYNYDWTTTTLDRPKKIWDMVPNFLSKLGNEETQLNIPTFVKNGRQIPYDIAYTSGKQRQTLLKVFDTLKKWTIWKETGVDCGYKPLRITISGEGGTGKSFIIQCIVSHIRRMTRDNDSVQVLAPTGNAAFNVHGVTIHSFAGLTPITMESPMSGLTQEKLRQSLQTTVALLIDERSMVDSKLLGVLEARVAATAHECCHQRKSWGGIPIVMLLGDDYQLPSRDSGVFAIPNSIISANKSLPVTRNGISSFMELSQEVIFLDKIIRQDEDQKYFKNMLRRIRKGWCTPDDEARLRTLILTDPVYTTQEIQKIKEHALYLFATNAPKNAFNKEKLLEVSGTDNPVAVCRSEDTTTKKGFRKSAHLQECYDLKTTYLCRGASVELYKTNLKPKYGLFNGAMGKIVDIIFHTNESPNEGFLPKVVIVDFPQYCGPAWDPNYPTHVPILPLERNCKYNCCKRKQVPLAISWARTIHKQQGQTAGFTTPTKGPYAVKILIVDLGERQMEGNNPGLTYVVLSRPTTIGDAGSEIIKDGKIFFLHKSLNSALYFKPGSFPDNIQNLTISVKNAKQIKYAHTPDSMKYKKVQARYKWVNYLKKNEWKGVYDTREEQEIIEWLNNTMLLHDKLLMLVRSEPLNTTKVQDRQMDITPITSVNLKTKDITSQYNSITDSNEKILPSHMGNFLHLLLQLDKSNAALPTQFSTNLQRHGKTYWESLCKHTTQKQNLKNILSSEKYSIYIPWLLSTTTTQSTNANKYWTLLVCRKKQKQRCMYYYTHGVRQTQEQTIKKLLSDIGLFHSKNDGWETITLPTSSASDSGPIICYVAALFATHSDHKYLQSRTPQNMAYVTRNYMKECLKNKKILNIF